MFDNLYLMEQQKLIFIKKDGQWEKINIREQHIIMYQYHRKFWKVLVCYMRLVYSWEVRLTSGLRCCRTNRLEFPDLRYLEKCNVEVVIQANECVLWFYIPY
jgi:hypothetical protein